MMSFGYFPWDFPASRRLLFACTILYYIMLSAAGVGLQWYVLYSMIDQVILGSSESAIPWVYCY